MQFRTEIKIPLAPLKIEYGTKALFVGSCFSTNIGGLLSYYKFDVKVNPFGTVYNAISIAKLLNKASTMKSFTPEDFSFNELTELYYCFDLHSDFSNIDIACAVDYANLYLEETHKYIKDVDLICITLGTSFVYNHHQYGPVANCHKVNQNKFSKLLCSAQDQYDTIREAIQTIRSINQNVKFIMNVSPIRHVKEGLAENSLSKSILRMVCHKLESEVEGVLYFPSYEIMMDDLRDYRFYMKDLIHPNEQAIEYIWNKFLDAYMDVNTKAIINSVHSIIKDMEHRPLSQSIAKIEGHREKYAQKISDLISKNSYFVDKF